MPRKGKESHRQEMHGNGVAKMGTQLNRQGKARTRQEMLRIRIAMDRPSLEWNSEGKAD